MGLKIILPVTAIQILSFNIIRHYLHGLTAHSVGLLYLTLSLDIETKLIVIDSEVRPISLLVANVCRYRYRCKCKCR